MRATRGEIAAAQTWEQMQELAKKYNYSAGFLMRLAEARLTKKRGY